VSATSVFQIDYSAIAQRFAPFYGTDKRIKVAFKDAKGDIYETKSGTVGMTTGWKPVLLLMLRSNSRGSSYVLSDADSLIG